MKRRMCCFLMATLQIITCYSVASWHFASHDRVPQQGQIPQLLLDAFGPDQGIKSKEGGAYGSKQIYRGLSRLGSRPPNCEHKCGGCTPCNAIQIPATNDHKRLEYANYEPEGWKCKCGTAFFNP